MKQENDEYLCKTFPKMFVNHGNENEPLFYGVECNDGWFNIINMLCQNIQHHLDWKNRAEEVVPQVLVTQIKEKFGTLRFYYDGGDEYVNGLVAMAESMSGVTCEVCGDMGESTSSDWIKVLCETHQIEHSARNED